MAAAPSATLARGAGFKLLGGDEKKFHEDAITRLRREHRRIQDRIDARCMDKLDGRIDTEFFDRQASAWRAEQVHILRNIETHVAANQSHIEEGIKPLTLARRAHALFENQCKLHAKYRQPFDVLVIAVASDQPTKLAEPPCAGNCENGLPGMDSNHELDRFLKSRNLIDSTKSLKSSKASKSGARYKIGTKYFSHEIGWSVASHSSIDLHGRIGFKMLLAIGAMVATPTHYGTPCRLAPGCRSEAEVQAQCE